MDNWVRSGDACFRLSYETWFMYWHYSEHAPTNSFYCCVQCSVVMGISKLPTYAVLKRRVNE